VKTFTDMLASHWDGSGTL